DCKYIEMLFEQEYFFSCLLFKLFGRREGKEQLFKLKYCVIQDIERKETWNKKSLCFFSTRYELVQRGMFTAKDTGLVPTVYTRNQQLEADNMRLRKDLENYKLAANKAKEAFLKMQKERDFHRMHHKRVVQEKNKLICDIKRLKAHYASYEPVLKQLTEKYQTTLRQKMLTSLERDRAVGQVVQKEKEKRKKKPSQNEFTMLALSSNSPHLSISHFLLSSASSFSQVT
uniref:Uncharacterized protein n=1 Tax=Accipiter nisus TaxID=211598 RepID=A0A8B9NLR2_9AVES